MSINITNSPNGKITPPPRKSSKMDPYSKRLQKLEADFGLMRDKLKYDDQTTQIQFQLLRKEIDESKDETKDNDKYIELERMCQTLTRHVTEKDEQLKAVQEELQELKSSNQEARSTPAYMPSEDEFKRLLGEKDKELSQQAQSLKIVREEINELKRAGVRREHQRERGGDLLQDSETEEYREDDKFDEKYDEKFADDSGTFDLESASDYQNDDDFEHHFLPGDTYSYFAVADYFNGRYPTAAFSLASFILVIQLVTLAIFMMDVFVLDPENPIDVPAGVGLPVRLSQLIALLISCWNQDELRASFNVISIGYNPDKVYKISRHANCTKWYLSIFIRIFLGCLSLLVTFVLIMNSDSVRDVMLDFAAVTFVSELDNGAFLLSQLGYMGRELQDLTLKTKNIPVYEREHPDANSKRAKKIPRLVSLLFVIALVCGLWTWLTLRQSNGYYMEETIFVQFGDDFSPGMAAFSGLYQVEVDGRFDGMRVDYRDLGGDKTEKESAVFTYCIQDQRWMFQYGANPRGDDDYFSECWWKARSSETDKFDITTSSSLTWFVVDEELKVDLPLQHFFVTGREHYLGQQCESHEDCGDRMACEEEKEGSKSCVCKEGLFGIDCEFETPCQTLEIDTRDVNGFFGTRTWSRRYSSVIEPGKNSPFQVYGKPMFFGDDVRDGSVVDVMLYNGRRWILTDSTHIESYNQSSSSVDMTRDLAEFLSSSFHAYWTDYTFYFVSEPVDVGTPTDSTTPVGLRWFRLETSGGKGASLQSGKDIWQGRMEIDANLFCAVCHNETNPCFYGSLCREDGTCECTTGSAGRLCQLPPDGNGLCDVFFNTPEFSFDGGDCCQETCTSTEQYACGKGMLENDAGVSAYGFIGYPDCQDPRFSSKLYGSATLFEILDRGTLRCGSGLLSGFVDFADGVWSGFEVDICKSIASATLGDPEAFEIVETTSGTRFTDLAEGKFDILIRRTTHTAERDIYQGGAKMGFSFVPTPTLYDGLKFGGVPPYSDCADRVDLESPECLDVKICINRHTSWLRVTESLFPDSMIVAVESNDEEIDGLQAGVCNVIGGEVSLVAEFAVRDGGFTGPVYKLGDNVFSKEPLSAVTRQDDRVWFKFVSWIFEALIQAEESGVTKETAERISPTDLFGDEFSNMFQRAVEANGNYGEIYEKNLEARFPRKGLNNINKGDTGLIYAFPFGSMDTRGQDPIVGGTIEAIRKRGTLNCGIKKTPGFAELDPDTGIWRGFDADFCRGIAAALLNGSPNVNFILLSSADRFPNLADGTVDVMTCTTTHTMTREVKEKFTGEGFDFTPPIFHDGMMFGGRNPFVSCVENLFFDSFAISPECPDTRICVTEGSTWLDAIRGPLGVPESNIVVVVSFEESYARLVSGDCNVIAGESSQLAERTIRDNGYPEDEDYFITARKFTKEPLAVVSRADDQQFSDFLRWVVFGLFYAAEQGVTREMSFGMPAASFLFGNSISGMWQHAISVVGNYDEIFERNFDGFLKREGLNNLNNNNGPQFYAKRGIIVN